MNRKEKILNLIKHPDYIPMSAKEIGILISVPKDSRDELVGILSDLELEGKIYKNEKSKYVLCDDKSIIRATFFAKSKSYGFAVTDDGERIFISPVHTMNASDKDIVLVKMLKSGTVPGKSCEGKVLRILSHSQNLIVGTFCKNKNFAFVVPDSKDCKEDIYIAKKHCPPDADGKKVAVRITKWPGGDKKCEGVIEKVLGYENDKGVDIESIKALYSLESKFPKSVELSALSFGDRVYDEETIGRKDYTDHMIFTIDGEDARDFDDAVEIDKTPLGYRLGVHIADVSYYVQENSRLDQEAKKRGTSVYLPGCVVPMLPTHLSNGLCSLNPGCKRLAVSVIINLDKDGCVTDYQIHQSVIESKYRMTYKKVQAILEGNDALCKEYKEIKDKIFVMKELKDALRQKRLENGSIDFDFPETKIVLDSDLVACDVYRQYSDDAHSIIEEFMLLANVCVAKEFSKDQSPCIYRIHEKPSYDKVDDFLKLLVNLGIDFKISKDDPKPHDFARLLQKIKGTKKESIISKIMLRTMMKAKYSDQNLGHFGLNFSDYCHFTSPIRRYPDLVVHRILKEKLESELGKNREKFLSSFVAKAAKSSSESELNAMEAERRAQDVKKAEYMSGKIGNVYDAVISSVTSFGIFAQTDFGIEGLISMSDLDDDFYEYDPDLLILKGKRKGKIYSIGDELKIIVKRADAPSGEIDFIIEDGE